MIGEDSLRIRNEIVKNIKLFQMKKQNMPNFIRRKREEIISKVKKYS